MGYMIDFVLKGGKFVLDRVPKELRISHHAYIFYNLLSNTFVLLFLIPHLDLRKE